MSTNKIQIARDYVEQHKASDVSLWQPFNLSGSTKFYEIYHRIVGGLYGECRLENGAYEIEIRGNESMNGNPIVFTFEDPELPNE